MTEVRDADGAVLASWWRLTNAPADWGASADVARWYYFRWRIEGAFKLLKSAGWDVEGWLQRTGVGLLRKLLVVIACCVQVWRRPARDDASAEWRKELLMRLSGRQVKRSVPVTTSGLLAGLWVWQSAQGVIGDHGADTPGGRPPAPVRHPTQATQSCVETNGRGGVAVPRSGDGGGGHFPNCASPTPLEPRSCSPPLLLRPLLFLLILFVVVLVVVLVVIEIFIIVFVVDFFPLLVIIELLVVLFLVDIVVFFFVVDI